MTQEERHSHYTACLAVASEEYKEVESQVKRLGRRLSALRMTINGLARLVDMPGQEISISESTTVITAEDRENARKHLRIGGKP